MQVVNTLQKLKQKIVIEKTFQLPVPERYFKNCFITCTGKTDGIGAQALALISTQLFSRETGIPYVHTPFQTIGHNEQGENNWQVKWENFLNLGYEEISINSNLGIKHIRNISDLSEIRPSDCNTLYKVTQCHKYTNPRAVRFHKIQDTVRQKYELSTFTKSSFLDPSRETLNLAVHMRRGDVSNFKWSRYRYTSNLSVIHKLEPIIEILKKLKVNYRISIFSQGDKGDFQDITLFFHRDDISLYLNECLFKTFHSLTSSDILIMSKSTLSYVASLISRGIIIYENFYHKPLRQWHIYKGERYKNLSTIERDIVQLKPRVNT